MFLDRNGDKVFSDDDRLLGHVVFADYPGDLQLRGETNFSNENPLVLNSRGFLMKGNFGRSLRLRNMEQKCSIAISKNGVARIQPNK